MAIVYARRLSLEYWAGVRGGSLGVPGEEEFFQIILRPAFWEHSIIRRGDYARQMMRVITVNFPGDFSEATNQPRKEGAHSPLFFFWFLRLWVATADSLPPRPAVYGASSIPAALISFNRSIYLFGLPLGLLPSGSISNSVLLHILFIPSSMSVPLRVYKQRLETLAGGQIAQLLGGTRWQVCSRCNAEDSYNREPRMRVHIK